MKKKRGGALKLNSIQFNQNFKNSRKKLSKKWEKNLS